MRVQDPSRVIWHDLECGAYAADLPVWRELARRCGGPVLDVGAGCGRVALDLARHGHQVTALDLDPVLVAELSHRAEELPIRTVIADARTFELPERFALIIVPMQTVQLLGGAGPRGEFLACAVRHLRPGGLVAIAITELLECFDLSEGIIPPLPDLREIDGVVYSSQPTAVREDAGAFVLQRLRERIDAAGRRSATEDRIRLDRLSAPELEREGARAGLRPRGRTPVAATQDHVGSVVVMLGG